MGEMVYEIDESLRRGQHFVRGTGHFVAQFSWYPAVEFSTAAPAHAP